MNAIIATNNSGTLDFIKLLIFCHEARPLWLGFFFKTPLQITDTN